MTKAAKEPKEPQPPDSSPDSDLPARRRFFDPRAAGGRLAIAAASGALALALTVGQDAAVLPWRVRAVVGWDTCALVYVILAWIMIGRASPLSTKRRAALEDPGRRIVFPIAVFASFFSLFSAVIVLKQIKTLPPEQVGIWTALALGAVVLSWVMTHTVFTLRYAHLYYRRNAKTHCLQFPGDEPPGDMDFAYFAFTVGMCFQVSDVVVVSRRARRAVLFHAMISFVYNTTILALSLNLVTNLVG